MALAHAFPSKGSSKRTADNVSTRGEDHSHKRVIHQSIDASLLEQVPGVLGGGDLQADRGSASYQSVDGSDSIHKACRRVLRQVLATHQEMSDRNY